MTAKFRIGDYVKFNHRELATIMHNKANRHCYRDVLYAPNPETLKLVSRRRTRKIARITYSPELQANLYYLGTNHRGKADIIASLAFRSYQLEKITEPNRRGRPRQKRKYTRLIQCQS